MMIKQNKKMRNIKKENVDFEKVWILCQRQHFLFDEFRKAGYIVIDPFRGYNRIIPRFFRMIHFKSFFPYKKIWYRRLPTKEPKLVIIREGIVTEDYLKWYRRYFPKVKTVGLFMNKIKDDYEINLLRKFNCEPTTGDPYDKQRYGISSRMSSVYLRHFIVEKDKPEEYDVYYIGKGKKGRLEALKHIIGQLRSRGITVNTYITSPYPYGITFGRYKRQLSYIEVLNELKKTKAILHLSQGASNGITFRVIESVVNRIKLITDDVTIIDTPVYNKNNVFIIGKDDFNFIKDFLDLPFIPIEEKIINSFYFNTDIKHYLENK